MPVGYLIAHLLTAGAVAWGAVRLPARSRLARALGVSLLGLVAAGFAIERRSDWAWSAMGLGIPDLVFFTNLTLQGVAALCALMWREAADRNSRVRAAVLTPALLGAALWSYAWYFAPLPSGLHGKVNESGYCVQTSDYSCSAAAAAMLLHAHGIPADEAEMASLCVTRAGYGTSPLGLYRGLAVKCRSRGLRPKLTRPGTSAGVGALGRPSIVSIGLELNAPAKVAEKMAEYGWQRGVKHAVVFLKADPHGAWIDVADPSFGHERWPTRDARELRSIWDGLALALRAD
ncbi:MAG: hypothetical protein ACO1SX_10315 [Actinomycetota bacterium]